MAGEQTLYTMAALWRRSAGLRTLYDFRPEQSEALKERIAALESGIAALPDDASATSLEALLRDFYALPADERSYVRGYWRLSDAAVAAGLDVSRIADTTPVVEGRTTRRTTPCCFTSPTPTARRSMRCRTC